jgi:hypothetical protein
MVSCVKLGFDFDGELVDGVRNADGAWRFIRRFAEACASPIVVGDGCDEDDLRAAEAQLGFPVPAALRQLYALIGRRDDLTRMQDSFCRTGELDVDETAEVLVFRYENQSVAEWGVRLGAADPADPPVVFRLESSGPVERLWRPFLDRVSLAGVEMVLSEWMLSGGFADNRDLDEDAVDVLEQRFRRLPIPDYPMWAMPDAPPVRWFSGQGAILREDCRHWLWVRAMSVDGLARVRQTLPGRWLADG